MRGANLFRLCIAPLTFRKSASFTGTGAPDEKNNESNAGKEVLEQKYMSLLEQRVAQLEELVAGHTKSSSDREESKGGSKDPAEVTEDKENEVNGLNDTASFSWRSYNCAQSQRFAGEESGE